VDLPLARLGEPALRAALWSALYAGVHTVLEPEAPPAGGWLARFRSAPPAWDPEIFLGLWR
jgi:hypothetical protein